MGFVTTLFRVVTTVYDLVTLPVYVIVQRPWNRRRKQQATWAAPLTDDPGAPMVRLTPDTARTRFKGCETVDALFRHAVNLHSDRPCLGTRVVKSQTQEIIDGKSIVKYDLGEYKWKTYADVESQVDQIGRGLARIGIVPETRVIIFAETREEWILTALACFRRRVIVCTIYATLGDEGIVFSVNETEGRVVITSEELLPRLQLLVLRYHAVLGALGVVRAGAEAFRDSLGRASRSCLEAWILRRRSLGSSCSRSVIVPSSWKIKIRKKGAGVNRSFTSFLQMLVEVLRKTFGVPLIAAPTACNTNTSSCCCRRLRALISSTSSFNKHFFGGTALMPKTQGDASVLRPTLMIAVPLLLNRIQKAVEQNLASTGAFKQNLFAFALPYKSYWRNKGYTTPLLNRIVFKKTRNILGGRLRVIVCGSAPLSRYTQEFLTNCLCCPIVQGYGLTETTAGATLQDPDDDIVFGVAGPPLNGVYIKLVDWDEGGYRLTDKPYPRGEIVVGGPTVAAGYFKRPELTLECFESGHIPWFYTGDIGEFIPQGLLRIIDRKKDLVKLQYGEYVSLGKVETALKTHPLVDNVCVIGSSLSTFTVALIQPSEPALRKLAETAGLTPAALPLANLCDDKRVTEKAANDLIAHCMKAGLIKFEIPRKYKLCKEAWTPESELVTAALKIRRIQIQAFYMQDIMDMYKGD
ncbi:unnamed protein product [Ixodes persulcatus]